MLKLVEADYLTYLLRDRVTFLNMAPTPHPSGGHVQPRGPSILPGDEVVISGISGLFPNSENVEEFSENLYNKVDMVTENDLNFHHPEAPKYLGKIKSIRKFDAQFFKILHSQAVAMDPMSRKLLEHAYMAMYDSGINPLSYRGRKVGVFIGSSYSDCGSNLMFNTYKDRSNNLSGCAKSMFANRISFWIDVKGPSYTLDCACVSSMVCFENAYNAMTEGECEAAIVGGCNICLDPRLGLNLRKSGMTSLDGKTKCFDKNGDGYVRSEAVTCLFLQKAKEAKRIYAEVCYVQAMHDLGKSSKFSYTRHTKDIENFLNNFYSEIDVSPKEVEYVEAEGSAIPEADGNELEAISKVFGSDKPVKVGCVKSNMGNSEAASGVCALTKVCLAYHQGKLPGNLNYTTPLDIPAVKNGKIEVLKENATFNRGYTAINNFSFVGTNCHVLLKGRFKKKDNSKYKCSIPRIVFISGRDESCVEKLMTILQSQPVDPEVVGMLHNIYQVDTPGHTCRGYTILDMDGSNKTENLSQSIEYYPGVKRTLWLVFSGMGSQWSGMAADLMRIPIFANAINKCHKALEPLGVDLIRVVTDPDKTIFDNILNCFIGISAVQIGLSDVLKAVGIVPDYIIGHSQGEMGCGYFDNCFSTEEMILSAYSRGIVSLETKFTKGAMAAVALGYKDILPLCPPEIDVACHNSNESATLSGPAEILTQFVADLTAKGIFAREVPSANIAFHSRYINHAGPSFLERLRKIVKEPRLRTEKWVCTSVPEEKWNEPLAKYSSAEYHTNNLLSPVLFEEAARLIPNNAVVVEVAPHGLLQAILKRSHPECVHIPLTRRGQAEQVKFLLEAFGKMYQEGLNFKLDELYPKIEYPVSTETQMISQYVHWEHSEDMPEFVSNHMDPVKTAKRELIISVHDAEYNFISGYIRNGRNIFPESAILQLVWENLSMFLGVKYDKMSVVFKNVHFYGEAVVKTEESLKLSVMINKGNDNFEVCHNGMLLANGTIASVVKPSLEDIESEESTNEKNATVLESTDIYKSLHAKGLTYKGEFQSIHEADLKFTEARIKWRGNWITLLDSMIQLNILSRNYDGITVPMIIDKITINVDDHYKIKININESYLNAKLYHLLGITRCGGVEMKRIAFEDKPNKEQLPDALESLSFVPNEIVGEVNINTVLQINLQLVADNVVNETVIVTEITKQSKSSLYKIVKNVADNLPNVNLVFNSIDIEKDEITATRSDLIVVNDLLLTEMEIEEIFNKIGDKTFILGFHQKETKFVNGHFNVLSTMKMQGKHVKLYRKNICTYHDATYVSIDYQHKFSWIPIVKNELQKTKRVVLISERQPHCGLLGFVRKLRRDCKNKVSLILIDDYHAAKFDKENSFFKHQLQKNLTFNVFVKGQWGSYYYLPISSPANFQNIKLINSVVGDIDSLRWTEIPPLPASNNLVQVCYAGPSLRDTERSIGVLEGDENGFGMDYSGIDSKGDRVMGLLAGGAITNTLQADPDLIWPVPEHWTLEEAATVPLPYVHAFYCLVVKGQLLKGQSVFVNGGAGALGQAVISLCLALNCTVYTTTSNEQKKQFLLRLFPKLDENNIGHSQNENFYTMVIINTKGHKCHFVVNCASGSARTVAMKCLAPSGVFIDVSNYDSYHNKPFGMSFVSEERNYIAANLSSIFKTQNLAEKKMLQAIIAQGITNGTVKPLSRVIYPTTEVKRAFRLLSTSKHRGRVLIKIKDAEISTKTLSVIPRVSYSSKGTYIVICDGSELGVELADRLVKRGARKLILHLHSKNVSGYLHMKFDAWQKLGTSIKISTENLQSERKCVQLLKDAEKLGVVQGMFIIQESTSSNSWTREEFIEKHDQHALLVVNMDVLSRNNCPKLNAFVIISRSSQNIVDEYITSVCDRICQARLAVGLPALSFRIELLDELQLDHQEEQRLQPQNIVTVLNALESSLKQKHSSTVTTFNLKLQQNTGFLDIIAKYLDIKNIDDVNQSLTVSDFVINELIIEEIKTLIEKTYKISYTAEAVKNTSILSLKTLSESEIPLNTKLNKGLGEFYTSVSNDELEATEAMIPIHTVINHCKKNLELDETEAHMILIPGFDGQYNVFETICERLKIQAMAFQLVPDFTTESIPEIASSIFKNIKKTFVFKSKFYLLGYSFGVNVALEVAALLEKEGYQGIVFCLDSSPEVLKSRLETQIGNLSENELQNGIAEHMCQLMAGKKNENLKEELEKLDNWTDKVDMCVNRLRRIVTCSTEYIANVLNSAYHRILIAKTYKPNLKLESELILIKGKPDPELDDLATDYGLSKYSKKTVKLFNIPSDHATAPQDCRVSNIVNKQLDPELLEDFKSKNLCETYLM